MHYLTKLIYDLYIRDNCRFGKYLCKICLDHPHRVFFLIESPKISVSCVFYSRDNINQFSTSVCIPLIHANIISYIFYFKPRFVHLLTYLQLEIISQLQRNIIFLWMSIWFCVIIYLQFLATWLSNIPYNYFTIGPLKILEFRLC